MRELTEMNREQLDLVWEDLDINEQQDVLRTLVSKVVVEDGIPQVQIAGS
jgi:hypothetical protein